MSEEEKNKIEDAIDIILRGNDIESSALILEKAIMDNYIIAKGRVNILKIATRQILNFIEEYKNKGSLDIIKEKVKANDKITKLQKENEELRKGQNSLMQSRKKWKDRYYKLKAKSRKIIDLMAQNIELQQFANIDTTDIDLICKRLHCNKKCRLVSKECIKKYFTRIIRR